MKFHLTLFYLFAITTSMFSQGSFTKEIISDDYFYANHIKITDDGGWLVGGLSDEILKFNSCGDLEWNKKYEFNDEVLFNTQIKIDLEGNILLLGASRLDSISN